ncbi:MAG TPA: hypothetical protein DDY75_07135 [Sphingobacterium sp.]|nr:hypothetical protein [Sphingobacterium sp.]HAL53658.1 hypothetical protein [Sphingobacterium sp.]HAU53852.1 hypothetical protein [Sphingobacterium sp.]HBI87647.1 hypothetical protein [Sphingobacterium sp.]HBX61926.1 hypothetical protein [Flavobacteriaceae bacterium]
MLNATPNMIEEPNTFYKCNLIIGISSFLITVTVRTSIIYSAVDNVGLADTITIIWNWFMLLSLAIAAFQTLAFTYKNGGISYVLLSILVIICLIITSIGMFLIPTGAILS